MVDHRQAASRAALPDRRARPGERRLDEAERDEGLLNVLHGARRAGRQHVSLRRRQKVHLRLRNQSHQDAAQEDEGDSVSEPHPVHRAAERAARRRLRVNVRHLQRALRELAGAL